MNQDQLISELRNSLQATTFYDKQNEDGSVTRITTLLISDEQQRADLTKRYVDLLKTIEPITQTA